jgi:UDP-N-acetyl-D-glucosamine dehydrogenase
VPFSGGETMMSVVQKKTKNMKNPQGKLRKNEGVVGILGLGYVGLPLAREFASQGIKVIGFDIDDKKVKILNSGRSIIKHIPHRQVRDMVKSRCFKATTNMARLKGVDAILICAPTPLTENREPDMRFVVSSTETIAKHLQRGQLVVLESTTYPGTTRELMTPILETSGLKAGKDFNLAYSPERENPGNREFSTKTIPKVVGGLTKKCLTVARELYNRAIVRTVPVSSLETAEAAKILENVYRCVNIVKA